MPPKVKGESFSAPAFFGIPPGDTCLLVTFVPFGRSVALEAMITDSEQANSMMGGSCVFWRSASRVASLVTESSHGPRSQVTDLLDFRSGQFG